MSERASKVDMNREIELLVHRLEIISIDHLHQQYVPLEYQEKIITKALREMVKKRKGK